MRFAAVPLLTLATDPRPAAVSLVAAAMALPWLLVALPAGVLVDRVDPARVIAAANLARLITSGLLVAAILTGRVSIGLLCTVAFVLTAAETFADSAAQLLLVRIVDDGALERANARFVSSDNIGLDLVGPLLSGVLFHVAPWLPFAVSGSAFGATALLMITLAGHRDGARTALSGSRVAIGSAGPAIGSAGPADGRGSVRAAFRAILADPVLRVLVFTVAVMAAAIAAAEAVLVVYSAADLRLPAALYPTLMASYSVGFLAGAAVIGRRGRSSGSGRVMLGSIGVIGAMLVVIGSSVHPAVAWTSFVLMGAAGGVWNVLSASRRQRRTPGHMVARVSSTFRAISWGALPVGAALGGVLGQWLSVPSVFVVSGVLVIVLGVAVGPFFLAGDLQEQPAS